MSTFLRRAVKSISVKDVLFFLLLVCVLCLGLTGPHKLHGDGREYILQTQAIVFQHSLAVDPDAAREYWNRTNPYGVELGGTRPAGELKGPESQAGGGFGGLYPDKTGRYRFYHHWLYSCCVAPIYAALHVVSPSGTLEYLSFRIFNVILLAAFLFLFWKKSRGYPKLVLCVLMILSPLIPYSQWQHPEIFCLFLAFLSFRLAAMPRGGLIAPLLLGLAASQNIPIIFFFPILIAIRLKSNWPVGRRDWLHVMGAYGVGGLIALSSVLYNHALFGTWNVIAKVGLASLQYMSGRRTWLLLASPLTGALWMYPACFFFLPLCVRRRDSLLLVSGGICLVAAAWLCTATANFNGGQVGSPRYTVWLMAPLWYLLSARFPVSLSSRSSRLMFGAGVVFTAIVAFHFRLTHLPLKNLSRFYVCCRAMPEAAMVARVLPYDDDAETLAENIRGHELNTPDEFSGIYIWELDRDLFLWVISRRGARRVNHLEWSDGERKHVIDVASLVYRKHPVLGDYAVIRMRGVIQRVYCNIPVTIRARTAVQAE